MNQRLQLPLSGIRRNKPDGIAEDGSLHEMVAMRPKDGAWRVVGEKSQVKTMTSGQRYEFLHQISPTRKAWWVTNSTGKVIGYYLVDGSGSAVGNNLTFDTYSGAQTEVSFAALGNVVIMIDQNDEVLQAYLFEGDTDTYRLVGDLLPDLFNATIKVASVSGSYSISFTGSGSTMTDSERLEADAAILSEIASEKESGYWFNNLYFRYAYELFDGSIVKHSQPIRAMGIDFANWIYSASWVAAYTKNTAEFSVQITVSEMTILQTTYAGLIKSVNIYACSPSGLAETDPNDSVSQIAIIPDTKKLEDVNNFYLVKKIALEDLQSGVNVDIFDGEDISDMTTYSSLPIDNNTAHTLYSDNPFNYNQRLFWSVMKNTLFGGYNPDVCNPYEKTAGLTGDFSLYFEVTIETAQGTKIVRSPQSAAYYFDSDDGYLECFAYPDTRASKLKIIVHSTTSGNNDYYQEYTLTPHKHFNFAFIEDAEFGNANTTTLATEVKTYWDYNRIQATELMNPLYFPAKNSYRVGHGTVVGLSTNAIAISTGQFGEYPVYVFTTDGIWALQIGNEEVLIMSVKPLSRHVCNNVGSILAIDGGSTFSTTKGLFIISGEKIIEISKDAEGSRLSVISTNSDYSSMLVSTGANNLTCDYTFLEYLALANLAYDFINNEIIVSASYNQYSWIYSIDNAMWYKVGDIWDYFIADFPTMYGVHLNNLDIEDMTVEDESSTQVIIVETRPLTFGITGLKRMVRSLLETYMVIASSNTLQVQIYGSANGIDYSLIYHDIISSSTLQRLLIGRTIYSCEYFILVISSGSVAYDGLIRNINIDVSSRFAAKLRNDMV